MTNPTQITYYVYLAIVAGNQNVNVLCSYMNESSFPLFYKLELWPFYDCTMHVYPMTVHTRTYLL